MVLEEAVTAARHSKSILLDILGILGMDVLVGIHMLNFQPEEVTSADVLGKANTSALR